MFMMHLKLLCTASSACYMILTLLILCLCPAALRLSNTEPVHNCLKEDHKHY